METAPFPDPTMTTGRAHSLWKWLGAISALVLVPAVSHGQGAVHFANNTATAVFNALTGNPAQLSEGIMAALYYAPAGETNVAAFVQVGDSTSVGIPVPGIFFAGTRWTPVTTAPGAVANFQVRAWESAPTFERAVAAPPMNGRVAFSGVSSVFAVPTGQLGLTPAATLPPNGLTPIYVGPGGALNPVITIDDRVIAEGAQGTVVARFKVRLGYPSDDPIQVDFATSDETALAGQDYVSTAGTVVFPPGQTNQEIAVDITGDVLAEPDETFRVNLSNPVNGWLARSLATCTITEIRIVGLRVDAAISFRTVTGLSYRLEESDDAITWTPVAGTGVIAGTGQLIKVTDIAAGCNPSRRYRLRAL